MGGYAHDIGRCEAVWRCVTIWLYLDLKSNSGAGAVAITTPPGKTCYPATSLLKKTDKFAYLGGFFRARLSFPTEYPHRPPKMKFESPIFHPNSMWLRLNQLSKTNYLQVTAPGQFTRMVMFAFRFCTHLRRINTGMSRLQNAGLLCKPPRLSYCLSFLCFLARTMKVQRMWKLLDYGERTLRSLRSASVGVSVSRWTTSARFNISRQFKMAGYDLI